MKEIETWQKAGESVELNRIEDEQLEETIYCTARCLAYLRGRGRYWGLATSRLASDLDMFVMFGRNRGWPEARINKLAGEV